MNSPGSCTSRCHSTRWRSQAMRWSSAAGPLRPSLYFQWAAMPSSAMRCISSVRIWTSKVLGDAMHLFGADLDLEGLAVRAHHAGVQGLVEIGPRNGDEILDAARNGGPLIVDLPQRRVAVLDRVGEDAQRHEIVDLVERDLLAAHFLEDGVGPFQAAIDARGDAFAAQFAFHGLADFAEEFLVGVAFGFDGAEDLLVGIRLQVLEGQILQLAADLAHAETVRDGRIDLDSLARDALPPLRAQVTQGAHVMQAVGQFHQDDANILHHGEQHLAHAFGLAVFGREYVQLGELGDAIDAARHLRAELFAHLFDGDAGVLHDIVEQTGFHGHYVHAHVGQYVRHQDGMGHVRFAGIAGLACVILAGEAEGLLQRGEIVLGAVLADLGFQFGVQLLHGVGEKRYWGGFGKTGGLGRHATSIVAGDPKKRRGSRSDGTGSPGRKPGTDRAASEFPAKGAGNPWQSCQSPESAYFAFGSTTMLPPVLFFFSAFSFFLASAFWTQSSAILTCCSYSSLVSVRSARSRTRRFS